MSKTSTFMRVWNTMLFFKSTFCATKIQARHTQIQVYSLKNIAIDINNKGLYRILLDTLI